MATFFLFACSAQSNESVSTIFYKVETQSIAECLCRLFSKQYGDEKPTLTFSCKPVNAFPIEDQVLLNEALDLLSIYDDPDPGVYDPCPPKEVLLRAQYAAQAQTWETLLRRAEPAPENSHGSDTAREPTEAPEMPLEDRRNSGIIVLLLLAQAYYKLLESTVSMASWFTALDVALNDSYLWTVTTITNLLKNHPDLQDFDHGFEPALPDLYPSTIGDLEWEEMVAPDAERFLSNVQKYAHSKSISDPVEGSAGWAFIELFRPNVNLAIERAIAYYERMRRARKRLSQPSASERDKEASERTPKEAHNPDTTRNMSSQATGKKEAKLDGQASDHRAPNHESFCYDIFLSHSSKDKPPVRKLAELLQAAGLRVWFDEWVIRPGDDIFLNVERGLELSRVLVLCLSPNALGSEWVSLERSTALFRDPTNLGRRFVPVLLADCTIPDTLRRYRYLDFRSGWDGPLRELMSACSPSANSEPRAKETLGLGLETEARQGPALTPLELHIITATPDHGWIYVTKSDAYGQTVTAGTGKFFDPADASLQARYLDAFESLLKHGLVRPEGGHAYRLTGRGFEARNLGKTAGKKREGL